MKNVQEIFNTVMEGGYYGGSYPSLEGRLRERYMCFALRRALGNKLITYEEASFAASCIEEYLKCLLPNRRHVLTLMSALRDNDLPHSLEDLLAIYQDWENRPKVKEQ